MTVYNTNKRIISTSSPKGTLVTHADTPAILVLADGRTFRGRGFGATGATYGEAVFNTAMTGYQESLTNPANHGKILVAAAPHIGNTGWNSVDNESRDGRIWTAGVVIRDLALRVSNFRAEGSLTEAMIARGVIGISGVDTRTVVRHLRDHGSQAAGIFSGEEANADVDKLVESVRTTAPAQTAELIGAVSTTEPYTFPADGEKTRRVVAYDLGLQKSTLQHLATYGIETVVVPANTPLQNVLAYNPDGIYLSDGPGDPASAKNMAAITREILEAGTPLFASGLGHQILGRALGLETEKLPSGHRGAGVPVKDLATGKVEITQHSHGYTVVADERTAANAGASITHVCLNDGTVEGLALDNRPVSSVQFHPGFIAGPNRSNPVFERFVASMNQHTTSTNN